MADVLMAAKIRFCSVVHIGPAADLQEATAAVADCQDEMPELTALLLYRPAGATFADGARYLTENEFGSI